MEYDERTATTVRRTLKQSYNKRHVQYYFHLHNFNHRIQSVFIVHSWQWKVCFICHILIFHPTQYKYSCITVAQFIQLHQSHTFSGIDCVIRTESLWPFFSLDCYTNKEATLSASLPSAKLSHHIHTNVMLKLTENPLVNIHLLFLVSQWWNNQLHSQIIPSIFSNGDLPSKETALRNIPRLVYIHSFYIFFSSSILLQWSPHIKHQKYYFTKYIRLEKLMKNFWKKSTKSLQPET